jgi:Beta-galactosidase jelly roll domain
LLKSRLCRAYAKEAVNDPDARRPPTSPAGLLVDTGHPHGEWLEWPVTGTLGRRRGGETPADPVRGALNNGGLFGERAGWYLPGFADGGWTNVSLPFSDSRPGVSWYRTTFQLGIPAGVDASLAATTRWPLRSWGRNHRRRPGPRDTGQPGDGRDRCSFCCTFGHDLVRRGAITSMRPQYGR